MENKESCDLREFSCPKRGPGEGGGIMELHVFGKHSLRKEKNILTKSKGSKKKIFLLQEGENDCASWEKNLARGNTVYVWGKKGDQRADKEGGEKRQCFACRKETASERENLIRSLAGGPLLRRTRIGKVKTGRGGPLEDIQWSPWRKKKKEEKEGETRERLWRKRLEAHDQESPKKKGWRTYQSRSREVRRILGVRQKEGPTRDFSILKRGLEGPPCLKRILLF